MEVTEAVRVMTGILRDGPISSGSNTNNGTIVDRIFSSIETEYICAFIPSIENSGTFSIQLAIQVHLSQPHVDANKTFNVNKIKNVGPDLIIFPRAKISPSVIQTQMYAHS